MLISTFYLSAGFAGILCQVTTNAVVLVPDEVHRQKFSAFWLEHSGFQILLFIGLCANRRSVNCEPGNGVIGIDQKCNRKCNIAVWTNALSEKTKKSRLLLFRSLQSMEKLQCEVCEKETFLCKGACLNWLPSLLRGVLVPSNKIATIIAMYHSVKVKHSSAIFSRLWHNKLVAWLEKTAITESC